MAQLPSYFDANQVEPDAPRELFPAGDYTMQITASDMEEAKKPGNWFLKLELTVVDGPLAGRKIFDRLNLVNSNPQAVDIAQRQLSAICHATGKLGIDDSSALHMIPMQVKVSLDVRKDDPNKHENNIKGYSKVGSGGASSAQGGYQRPAAANQQSEPQEPSAPKQASGGSTPPWKRNAA